MKVVLASANTHKIEEIRHVLPAHFDVVTQDALGIESPPETGRSFEENALIKARHASRLAGLPAIADDSGLEVDHLDGGPGIYSSRYAGPKATDDANNRKLLRALSGVPAEQRTARFRCVIAFVRDAVDPAPLIARGCWDGVILTEPRGTGGFGYDPLFYLPGSGKTVAELTAEEKREQSHRGQALTRLRELMSA
jgi:XTP/dITP diphosphohydrolase